MLKVINRIISKIKYEFEYIDLGGGMGIPYQNERKKYLITIIIKIHH